MKRDIIIVLREQFESYSQVQTWSGYRDEQHATLELLKQSFSFYPKKGLFKAQRKASCTIAKIIDLTDNV